ncbi:MAG: DUF4082 domain-containing protein [Acidimicrobiales bacterium]
MDEQHRRKRRTDGSEDSDPSGTTGEDASRGTFGRRIFIKGAASAGIAAASLPYLGRAADAAPNPISVENAKPGNPSSEWDVFLQEGIEGFATEFSVNAGETIHFKISTPSTSYRIEIYRLGWYQGNGARRVATILPTVALPQAQPAPFVDVDLGLVDCANWAVSASWAVPTSAVSGVYFANLLRQDAAGENRIMFVVRNDGRAADVVLQTSDTTYQAYNRWGGYSLYGGPAFYGRATKVSYNRPFEDTEVENVFMYAEYPLVRWLERNGYDVAYISGIDTDRRGGELLNKKVYISSGHDEYWSKQQRTNVEAARGAGVHLAFLTGNEVFWKVRWEPASDGTPYRTLVCYKETIGGQKIDPSPEWTGTWRDRRLSPPADGGLPENALTGTLFRAINLTGDYDFAIKVPYEYRRLRLWRNTSIVNLTPGQTATLAEGSLGYEWDSDEDNGFRPAGLIRLSETTEIASQVLDDEGVTYHEGPLTHHLTMYRAAGGAVVFGSGTCQWSWGLDEYHLSNPQQEVPADVRMRQATVNLLADMGVQPATLQAGLVAASASGDHLPPVSTITTPAEGATVPVGAPLTVTGTATDAGGGQVAGVEVSIDGGTTWHPATGRTTWSYTFMPTTLGPITIRHRAVDDSCNLETPSAGTTINGGPRPFPCTIWHSSASPANPAASDPTPVELGVRFRPTIDGFITGLRFYKGAGNTGTHVGHLWTSGGALLATATFTGETVSGWQQANLPAPVPVTAGTTFVASYFAPNGHYAADGNYFATSGYEVWPLRALVTGEDGPNGVYRDGSSGFPTSTYNAANYWVDVVFNNDNAVAPAVVDRSPAPGIEAVAPSTAISASFSEAMNPSSIVLELRDEFGAVVAGSTAYHGSTRTATFTPSSALATRSHYTATVTAAQDVAGNPLAAAVSWSFTTTTAPGGVPTSLWDSSAGPATPAVNDANAIELGVKFKADVDGHVTAIRFFKGPGDTGTHVGHLWSAGGALLATVTFADESAAGWQQANLDAPVPVTKGSVYVASYHAPVGRYPATSNFFAGSGVDRGPLHGLPSGASGPNGVYRYGEAGFPTSSWAHSNYWVDVMFGVPPDVLGPTVVNQSPGPNLESVATGTTVTATFDEAIDPSSLGFTLRTGAGANVAGAAGYDAASRSATFTPGAALALGATYTAEVSAADPSGNTMTTPAVWSFTTVAGPGLTPCSIWDTSAVPAVAADTDTAPVELGVKLRTDGDGVITAIRFYKGPGNVGPHIGHLWTATGTLLGSVTFAAETATGWQQANLATPIPVGAATTYVASYHAPAGRFAATGGFFTSVGADRPPLHALRSGVDGVNGVYRYGPGGFPTDAYGNTNYWVDVVFRDTSGPSVVAQVPEPGTQNVAATSGLSVRFNEAVQPGTISFELRDSANAPVSGSLTYDPSTMTATFQPNAALAGATSYTATVSGARDVHGNPMAAPVSWSFTTAAAGTSTIFGPTAVPELAAANDAGPLELGVRFMSAVAGEITGVRFYKGPGNTGTHVGNLWSASGALLATAVFATETSSGWQQVDFATPVPVTANATYVASYHAPAGRYSTTRNQFNAPVDAPPLHAFTNGVGGGNGLFAYGSGGFPTGSFSATNYWVDVVFRPT